MTKTTGSKEEHVMSPDHVMAAAEDAATKIAPVWPLKHFVAVNPFLGLADKSFTAAADRMAKVSAAHMTMPRSFYQTAIDEGRISDEDLAAALKDVDGTLGAPKDLAALKAAAGEKPDVEIVALKTVADVVDSAKQERWSDIAVEHISTWAADYFDEGQASWAFPWRDLSPYAAWRTMAMVDKSPEMLGLKGFKSAVTGMPATAEALLASVAERLGLSDDALPLYFHRVLMMVGGWSSYARYQVWENELYDRKDTTLIEFLAICVAWDLALFELHLTDARITAGWSEAVATYTGDTPPSADLVINCILQTALDHAWQRGLIGKLSEHEGSVSTARKDVQAAFCIDVRSEVFRRALEQVAPNAETIGFAGFFGFSIEYVPLGQTHGGAQCPVLLTPQTTVCETVHDATEDEVTEALGLRLVRRRAAKAWKSFKLAAVSSFAFVEAMGWTYIFKLASDALGLSRPVPHPSADGIDADVQGKLGPDINAGMVAGRETGFVDEDRINMAATVLGAMSLTESFARLVLLAGHGSTTVNNPHATGLDCGACGGHTGEANARVAAAILNDPTVRLGLKDKGIEVPDDTVFLAGLHDTTTDEVLILNDSDVPATHRDDLSRLRGWLDAAGHLTRVERSALLGLEGTKSVDSRVWARSRDWSQVRPEWGLAGCAAFIAAPRERTAGLSLAGRSFLHSYDWEHDEGFGVLELIMTAPMVVASWISLQYFGSTVDNKVFGCGNKTLHNVTGTVGVLEGNGGDLRTGLPWQSVHDGEKLIHEPLRLAVCIEAPVEAMTSIIDKHAGVRDLLDNRWLYLFAMNSDGNLSHRYDRDLKWTKLSAKESEAEKDKLKDVA